MITITESKKEYIFEEDREFQSAHASTLVNLENGDILAAWFGGSWEGNPDVAIWMARRTIQGWQKPFVVSATWASPLWNPILFRHPSGRVLLFYKEGKTIPQWRTVIKYSDDGGKTFSDPRQLVSGQAADRGPSRNKVILLSNGSIAAPGSTEPEGIELWDCFVDISRDGGETWELGPFIPIRRLDKRVSHPVYDKRLCFGRGLIQPTLWESQPGYIHALMRSTSAAIFRSDSSDGGKTWCCAYNTGLPNNNSGIDLVKLPSGDLVLAYNPVPWDWGPRTPLILSCSDDNGETWKQIFTLEDTQGEYSYPAIICDGKDILLTYTWHRERVAFWRLKYSC
jgi:predicted neuraminidase